MKNLPLPRVYELIEPGPVVLVTTLHRGRANVMTMSWLMMVEFTPPQIACILSNRNFSFTALKATKECVIAVPSHRLAQKIVKAGNLSGRRRDKFAAVGLTPLPASHVAPPLVSECFANLECMVIDTRLVDDYCLFILQVVKAWIDPAQKNPRMLHHRGRGVFAIDGKVIRLKSAKL